MGWRERAKEHWLNDKNSKFFHASVYQQRRANHIHRIIDDKGSVLFGRGGGSWVYFLFPKYFHYFLSKWDLGVFRWVTQEDNYYYKCTVDKMRIYKGRSLCCTLTNGSLQISRI